MFRENLKIMDRDTLESAIKELDGLTLVDNVAKAEDGFVLTLFVGPPGRGTALDRVDRLHLRDKTIIVYTDEPSAQYCMTYDAVAVVGAKNEGGKNRRAGFA